MLKARPGLYALADDGLLAVDAIPDAVAELVSAGCDLVQLRVKQLDDREHLDVQRAVCRRLPQRPVTLVVNDRADLARVLLDEAPPQVRVGLHLGQGDLSPSAARRVLGDRSAEVILGLSTHNDQEVFRSAVEEIDYIGFGPIHPTTTKAAARLDPVVGFEGLKRAVARAAHPVVAIGGLRPRDAEHAHEAGAQWIAMAGALWRPGVNLARVVAEVQAEFAA